MLKDEVKRRMIAAMKAGDTVEKEILRVLRGELDTAQSRQEAELSDEESQKIVRKLVKSNEETLSLSADGEQKQTLTREISILQSLLPKLPSVDEIVTQLAAVTDQIRAAGNDGQATGVAMKLLKSAGVASDGKTVATAVKLIRSS
jgi:uncharacterized protein YqeY